MTAADADRLRAAAASARAAAASASARAAAARVAAHGPHLVLVWCSPCGCWVLPRLGPPLRGDCGHAALFLRSTEGRP